MVSICISVYLSRAQLSVYSPAIAKNDSDATIIRMSTIVRSSSKVPDHIGYQNKRLCFTHFAGRRSAKWRQGRRIAGYEICRVQI